MQDSQSVNWDLYRVFFSLAATGSLTQTAAGMGISPPTVSRRISQLERALDLRLFDRTRDGYTLTRSGKALLPVAEQVAQAAHDVERSALALGKCALDTVRISCGHWTARYLLNEMARFRSKHPEISLEIHTTANIVSLAGLEADVALRNVRPRQGRLKIRKVGAMDHAVYASPRYVASNSANIDAKRWSELDWIGPTAARHPVSDWLADHAGTKPSVRCSSPRNLLDAASASLGLALLPRFVGDHEDALVRVSGEIALPNRDLWLVVHEDLAQLPAIKAVCAWLAGTLDGQK